MLLLLACSGPDPDDSGTPSYRFHPEGYALPATHGPEALLGVADCTMCHGADLYGAGAAGACDECHDAGWRTNCTFCHGGTADSTGAPPTDLDGSSEGISFPDHTAHVSATTITAALDCSQCHVAPADVLSEGHLFDATPAAAEVDFSRGIARSTTWDGAGCANVYCHGSGQRCDGTISSGATISGCDGCHPHQASGEAGWATMSGEHARHLAAGWSCGSCHGSVVSGWDELVAPAQHVDGDADVSLVDGMKWESGSRTCTGACHDEAHDARRWGTEG